MKNTTKELREMQRQGRRVVCQSPGYEGRPVFYSPRSEFDPKPWRLAGELADNGYRFSGAELSTIPPRITRVR